MKNITTVILSQQPWLLVVGVGRYNIGYMQMKDRIARRMAELGITQESLAEKTGISQTAIHKILTGGGTRKMVDIARALSCTPEYLQLGSMTGSAGSSDDPLVTASVRRVPIISSVQAGDWCDAEDPYPVGQGEGSVLVEADKVSASAFAVRCEGP